jgi:hypothetical protein
MPARRKIFLRIVIWRLQATAGNARPNGASPLLAFISQSFDLSSSAGFQQTPGGIARDVPASPVLAP